MSKNTTWGGRFTAGPAQAVTAYTESLSFDTALFEYDIDGSQAHATMLGHQKVILPEEMRILVDGLEQVRAEIRAGTFVWKPALEDVHMNIEARLTEIVGDVGKKLHTGRSRNDQVALAFRLYVSDALREWQSLCRALITVFVTKAETHVHDILPGCTHMQPAQPVSLAQHLLAYAFMLQRDVARMDNAERRVRISPLGAGALAGSTYPLAPELVAESLNMYGIFDNSMDAVSDRDFVLEALFAASCTMMHVSRFCEEMILWANPAFGFARLPDAYTTGSSMMPQKRNPDVAELMRGKVGRVYGALMGMFTVMKGLPLTYNRDMQEDKEPFLDTDTTLRTSLSLMASMLSELEFCTDTMRAACKVGYLNATELADYLVTKGIPFREAHHMTGKAVAVAENHGVPLEHLDVTLLQTVCSTLDKDVFRALDPATAVARRETLGGTGPNSVARQIANLRAWLTAPQDAPLEAS